MLEYTITEKDAYGDTPVPEGYEVVDFRPPLTGDLFQPVWQLVFCKQATADFLVTAPRRILRKKPEPKRFTVTFEFDESSTTRERCTFQNPYPSRTKFDVVFGSSYPRTIRVVEVKKI